ncbi:MAG: tetratricopeptide repeat protein [Planctomycetota bacterium]
MRKLLPVLLLTALALADDQPVKPLGFSVKAPAGGIGVLGQTPGATAGLVVSSVDPGGFAERGGLRAGDVIDSVEGQPVSSVLQMIKGIPRFATEVRVSVLRGGQRQDLILPLAAPPRIPDDRQPPRVPDDPRPPDDRQPPPPNIGGKPPADNRPPRIQPKLPANVLPFLITEKGFAQGYTTWFLDELTKLPVAQASASADGAAIAWVDAQGKLVVWRDGATSEVPLPGPANLLGWMSDREVALSSGTRDRAQVDAIDVGSLQSRTLFTGDLARELLPAPSCVSGYLPAAGVFARVVVNKPTGSVSFYRQDGKRHGTLVPFEGPISACAFGPSFAYVVKGAGEVFPAVPGLPKQGSLGLTLPQNAGFCFSPDGRYYLATVRGAKGGELTLTDVSGGQTQTVFAECDRVVIGWQGAILLAGGDGLFRLSLVPRNAPNLAIEARDKEAAGDRDGAEAVWMELLASFPAAPEAKDASAWLAARQRERDDERAKGIVAEAARFGEVERFEDAIALLEGLRRELPTHPSSAEALKTIAGLQGRIEERERRKRDELIAMLMTQASQTAVSGKWPEAIRQFESVRQQFPGLPCDAEAARQIAALQEKIHQAKVDAAVGHAKETESAGKWADAIEEYKAIRAVFPGEPCDRDAAAKIVELEMKIRDAAEAEVARQQQSLLEEGEENERADRPDEAVKVYEDIRRRWPGSEPSKEAVRRIGAIEAKLRETKAAEFAARIAERMESAKKLADLGDLERARQEAQAVLASDPEHAEAKLLLAAIEKSIDQAEEKGRAAKADFERQVATAKALLEGGDLDGAEKAYRGALALDPSHLEAQVGLARIVAERKKKQVGSQLALAKRCLELGKFDEARAGYQQVLAIDPENTEATVGLLDVEEAAKKAVEKPKPPAEAPRFVDFAGPVAAQLGCGASTVREKLGRPDLIRARGESNQQAGSARVDEWTYAAAGIVVAVSRESLRVVEVQVLGKRELVAEGVQARFAAFVGKSEKEIGLGDAASAVTAAYGQAKKRQGLGGEFLALVRDDVEMAFRIEGDRVVAIVVRAAK